MNSRIYRVMLFLIFIAVWLVSAWNPASRYDWILENCIIIFFLPVVYYVCKSPKMSNLSCTLIFIYACLHLVGSYYMYSHVPFGDVLGSWLGSERNMYDRLLHFSCGLFLFIPVHEMYLSYVSSTRNAWSYVFPWFALVTASAFYEIGEWIVAAHTGFRVAANFIAAQGDVWDAQKDMFLGSLGALIAACGSVLLRSFLNASTSTASSGHSKS